MSAPESPLLALRRRLAAWFGIRPRAAPQPPSRSPERLPGAAGLPQAEFARRADRVDALRREAHLDEVSGLPNRAHFTGRLAVALDAASPDLSMLLLRAMNLDALRAQIGADAVERRLALVGEALDAYPQHVAGAFAGRLNDSDFALCLPAPGVAAETGQTLLGALRATPAAGPGGIEIAVGGLDGLHGGSAGAALAAADLALAHAEQAGAFGIEIHRAGTGEVPAIGEQAWRERIAAALDDGRAKLGENAVRDRSGSIVHRACRLLLQLEVAGPFRDGQRWLAMAARTRLLPRADLLALELALVASARDGAPRSVRLAAASLTSPGFADEVARRLAAEAAPAGRLLLEIGDGPWLDRVLPRLEEAAPEWRRLGARVGVEHAGSMHQLARLDAAALDHVRVEGRLVRGVAAQDEVRAYAAGLVDLVHAMGLRVIADGVDDDRDVELLFALGVDAVSGAAADAERRP